MTHSSYSRDNNRAFSLLGLCAMKAAAALSLLREDPETSAAAVNGWILEIAVSKACVASRKSLGIEMLVPVAAGATASSPTVIYGSLMAMFGAISVDAGGVYAAGKLVLRVFGGGLLLTS